ncbi:potassium channel family protein [Herbaspirillum sp. meg3]|uniref:potassium channel family protein n=1 Tax=Herbaspirillum sp. meg3 TaxID=2025949 RepID=UPI001E3855A1|nr:potassium channel family protein [Herbaspirillum sp. meg3]
MQQHSPERRAGINCSDTTWIWLFCHIGNFLIVVRLASDAPLYCKEKRIDLSYLNSLYITTEHSRKNHLFMDRYEANVLNSRSYFSLSSRPLLMVALLLSIPAFYLVLNSDALPYRDTGRWLYGVVALLAGFELWRHYRAEPLSKKHRRLAAVDLLIVFGAIASAWPYDSSWHFMEWLFRLAYCAVVFLRLSLLVARYVAPHRLLQIGVFALFVLAIAGEGFLLLEPKIHSYADGVWLAFLTVATLGYGDLVPSAPGSRVFAVFIVLLGYALFSVFTASISAILVGEDEKRLRHELHMDTRMLRAEIAALRKELREGLLQDGRRSNGDSVRQEEA